MNLTEKLARIGDDWHPRVVGDVNDMKVELVTPQRRDEAHERGGDERVREVRTPRATPCGRPRGRRTRTDAQPATS